MRRLIEISPTRSFVVDNASTDTTASIAAALGVRVVKCDTPGLTHARQAGMFAARYSVHAYVDADCRPSKMWLTENLPHLIDDPNCVAISGPIWFDGQRPSMRLAVTLYSWAQILTHRLMGGQMIQGGNYIVKSAALLAIGGHPTDVRFYGEDTASAIRLGRIGRIKWLPKMWMHTSARRFEAEGYARTAFVYAVNFFSMHWLGRPLTRKHKDYRTFS